jgi:hypothetical protein
MIVDNVRHVELDILSDPVHGGYGYKVSQLSQVRCEANPREVRDKPTMKSIQMFSHFHSGTLKGYKFWAGLK